MYTPPAGTGALRTAFANAGGKVVGLAAGTYDFTDFKGFVGVDMAGGAGLSGAGSTKTVVQMAPRTSTKGSSIPKTDWTTNNYSLLNFNGSPRIGGFTLQGTEQGHTYNGLRVSQATNAVVSDVRVRAIPGDGHIPPGETFGINDWRTSGSRYSNIEVDGANKVAASGFATNSSADVTVDGGNFHDMKGGGATFWQTKNITLKHVTARNNTTGLNFERVSGAIRLERPTFAGNNQDVFFATDQDVSGSLTIIDPIFSKTYSGVKVNIQVPNKYMGATNRFKKSDVRVIINGVDRTAEVVHWVNGG